MPKPFAVRVLRLADETTQDMPYKSFTYIMDDIDDVTRQKKFELVGEIDKDGNLVPGSPNLLEQHRTEVPKPVVAEVVADVAGIKTEATITPPAIAVAREKAPDVKAIKRRNRKPAQVTLQETQA